MAAAISSSDTILLFDRRKLGACDRQTGTRDSIMFYVDDSVGKYMQCVTFSKIYLRSRNGIINHVFICMTCILELSKVGRRSIDLLTRQATGHQMSQQGQYLAENDQKCLLRRKMVCIGSFYRGTNNTPFLWTHPKKNLRAVFQGSSRILAIFGEWRDRRATALNFGSRSTKLEFPKHISGD